MTSLSVIICTHNPVLPRLNRVLAALRQQSLATARWELLVIDNASAPPLAPRLDLSWHPRARILVEQRLGLTSARLRGIAETSGDVIVFVDDDNILATDYLEEAGRIAEQWPMLGAWGGRIDPEFEIEPPSWTRDYWFLLAISEINAPLWSNQREPAGSLPTGAGQCIRQPIARHYAQTAVGDPLRVSLDRVGSSLSSCGDIDLALTAIDLGFGTGRFPALRLTHVIPAQRLQADYLLKLAEGVAYSAHVMNYLRGQSVQDMHVSGSQALSGAWRRFRLPSRQRAMARAFERGRCRALKDLARLDATRRTTAAAARPPPHEPTGRPV